MKRYHRLLVLVGLPTLAFLSGCNNFSGQGSSSAATTLSVAIKSPQEGAYTKALEIEASAAAVGPGARVDRVEVQYVGPVSGTITLSVGGGSWRGALPGNIPSGQYTLTPKAWMGGMEKAGPPVRFTLDRDPPEEVSFQPPNLSQGMIQLRVRARDTLSGVREVRLYAGNQHLGPFSPASGEEYVFSLDVGTLPQGTVVLRAVAEDMAGNTREATLNLTLDRTPPTVVWKRPADGARVTGQVTLEVEATDNVGVAKVEFFAGSTKLGEATAAPYTFNWDTTLHPDGPVTLKAKAWDAAGNFAEATLTVTVANDPVVEWLNPGSNQSLAGFVNLEVKVRAVRAIDRVDFYFGPSEDSMSLIPGSPTQAGNVYSLGWNILRVTPGNYLLKARVIDSAGASSEAVIPVEIASAFVITTPKDGDTVGGGAGREIVTITIGVNGTLPPGVSVSRVDVYINGSLAGQATQVTATDSSRVYVYEWDTSQAGPGHDPTKSGDRVITARVYYTTGGDTFTDTFTNGVKVLFQP